MSASSLVIVADRGGFKAFRVSETPTRGVHLELAQYFEITGAERELPFNVEASKRRVMLVSDWPALEGETDRRVERKLANEIAKIVKRERVEGWSLAAEPPIHRAIVDLLPVALRQRIVEHVPSDLVKTAPAKLPSHFRSLQPWPSSRAAAERSAPRKQRTSKRTAKS